MVTSAADQLLVHGCDVRAGESGSAMKPSRVVAEGPMNYDEVHRRSTNPFPHLFPEVDDVMQCARSWPRAEWTC